MATGPWSDDEIDATIDVYFQMLTLELAGERYTKAIYQREVARTVDRSLGAISMKFNNVSAVLDELGAVWIDGYKPLRNLQDRLRERVAQKFQADAELRGFMLRAVADEAVTASPIGREVEPPSADWADHEVTKVGILGVNFAAIESANRALGRAGEASVVAAERLRLLRGGRPDLAEEVRHAAVVDGDGLGYDIQSFRDLTDDPVYIEVKTTRYAREIPFYLTQNELEASNDFGPAFRLFRLYRYSKRDSGYYTLLGPLVETAVLKPATYRGLPLGRSTAS